MFTTVITDCWGENEKGRQVARYNSLGLGPTDLIGVKSDFSNDATIEGGANIVDILDATEGKKGVIVLNVAPRGDKKDGSNGTHFCYFFYKETLVISTIKGYCLSFVKKYQFTNAVRVVELSEVLNFLLKKRVIDKDLGSYIVKSQFRSFDFVPRLARWLTDGIKIPSSLLNLESIPFPPHCIWHIDAFGNAKTTILSNEVSFKPRQKLVTNLGGFNFFERLKDVPRGETAIYIGSSGFGDKRFLEIATQAVQGSASRTFDLKIGDTIKIK